MYVYMHIHIYLICVCYTYIIFVCTYTHAFVFNKPAAEIESKIENWTLYWIIEIQTEELKSVCNQCIAAGQFLETGGNISERFISQ
jgi:hypothetical protein